MQKQIIMMIIGVMLVLSQSSCDKKEDTTAAKTPATDNSSSETPSSTTATTSTSTTEASSSETSTSTTLTTALTGTAATAISKVQTNMIPGSLLINLGSSLALDDGGPCGTKDFFSCQPILLKVYLSISRMIVGATQAIVDKAGSKLSQLTLPSSGSVTSDDGDDVATIDYTATSATKYSVLFHTKTDPFLKLAVDGNQYTISMDSTKSSDFDGSGPGQVEAVINYTDDNNFTVDLTLAGFECDPNDVRAPAKIGIHLVLMDGLWQGKAMMGLPRWVGDNTCSTTPSADTEMYIYTDFVGDATNTSMSVFMLPPTLTASSAITNYPISSLCSTFPSMCQNGYGVGGKSAISAYINPICVTPDEVLNWGAACSSSNTTIATPTYGDSSLWVLPADLDAVSVTVPTSL